MFYRDNRLNSIHEGTYGVQSLDLLARKVPADNMAGYTNCISRMRDDIETATQRIAMPTQHLNRQAIGARAVFGWPGLDDRRQEIQQYLCASALGLVRSSAHVVSQLCTE